MKKYLRDYKGMQIVECDTCYVVYANLNPLRRLMATNTDFEYMYKKTCKTERGAKVYITKLLNYFHGYTNRISHNEFQPPKLKRPNHLDVLIDGQYYTTLTNLRHHNQAIEFMWLIKPELLRDGNAVTIEQMGV